MNKEYTQQECDAILARHRLWLEGEEGGEQADFWGDTLRSISFKGARLNSSNFREATLIDVDFTEANLNLARFDGAVLENISFANGTIEWASFEHANLTGANLEGTNLRGSLFNGAILRQANLQKTNLRWGVLRDADLCGANFKESDLYGASLERVREDQFTIWPPYPTCPLAGTFTAYKAVRDGIVLTLEIPDEAERTGSRVGKKCRASKARVVSAHYRDGKLVAPDKELVSIFNTALRYQVGEFVAPDHYDPNPNVECTNGIHFFMNEADAQNYSAW